MPGEANVAKAGLEGIVAAESRISDVNGDEGWLIYAGYDIHDLAEHSTFEEVVYLLWYGRLPHKQELETISESLRTNAAIPPEVVTAMKAFPKDANSMEVLRTAVSMLSMYDPDDELNDRDANVRKATR